VPIHWPVLFNLVFSRLSFNRHSRFNVVVRPVAVFWHYGVAIRTYLRLSPSAEAPLRLNALGAEGATMEQKKEPKQYTREDKIQYYLEKILKLKLAMESAENRLRFIMSDQYQDWNSNLAAELSKLKEKYK